MSPLTLKLDTVNQLTASGDYSTSKDAGTSGHPRLWLDYGDAAVANLTVNNVASGSAFGFIGSNIDTISIAGSVAAGSDGWGQLQIWDKGAELSAINKLVLNMSSATDLGAYAPYGILTRPTEVDGSGSTGALKITPDGFSGLSWTAVKTGSGNDELAFSGDHINPLTISAGAGHDKIAFGVNTTVTGGEGDDTFIITAPAGTGEPTKQMSITDYGTGNDVIDLSQVSGLKLNGPDGDRLEVHQGGKWGLDSTEDDVVVQLSGGSGSQLIINGAYDTGKTLAFKLTEEQAGLAADSDVVRDFLVNITENGQISASSYTDGAILSGGGGNQTLISGSGNDFMQGGGGDDTFKFDGQFGIDVILDYENGDNIETTSTLSKNAAYSTVADLSSEYSAIATQLTTLLGSSAAISVFEDDGADNNAIILIGNFDEGDLFPVSG